MWNKTEPQIALTSEGERTAGPAQVVSENPSSWKKQGPGLPEGRARVLIGAGLHMLRDLGHVVLLRPCCSHL